MTGCTSCGGCACGCGGCSSHVLLLTEPELRLLRQFAELAFLPAACTQEWHTLQGSTPPASHCSVCANVLAISFFPAPSPPLIT